ncbi:MAG TPA: hypothetical protein VF680_05935 [Allosphingosinicella sp.]|jgi:hypothetical protein
MLGLLAAIAAAAPGPAAPPLTRGSVERMSPEEVATRVLGEMGSAVYTWRVGEARPGDEALRQIDFLSRPRGSYRAGVCELDWLAVSFDPVPTRGRDAPVRPSRLQQYDFYLVRDAELAREDRAPEEGEQAKLELACAQVDPRNETLVTASTAFAVVDGLQFLGDLTAAAKAKRALAPLECSDEQGMASSEADCLQRLAGLKPRDMYGATLESGCAPEEPDTYCRTLHIHSGRTIVIRGEWKRGASKPSKVTVGPDLEELIGH